MRKVADITNISKKRVTKKEKERIDRYEKNKALRRTGKRFNHLKPRKVGRIFVLKYNDRVYRNKNRKALLDDIATVENGLS